MRRSSSRGPCWWSAGCCPAAPRVDIFMYVCMYVCMKVVYVCISYELWHREIYVCMHVCVFNIYFHLNMYVCMYVYICQHELSLCVFVCSVCMYVCMYRSLLLCVCVPEGAGE